MRTHDKIGFKGSTGYNGKYNNEDYKEKIRTANISRTNNTQGILKEFQVRCFKCLEYFNVNEREFIHPIKSKYFCSRSCANSGRFKTEEQRRNISNKLKDNSNRKKMCSRISYCKFCKNTFKFNNRIFCSSVCKKRHLRKNTSPINSYRKDCAFTFNLKDFPEEFNFSLIEEFGWYKAKNRGNNLNGVSRDHIISIRYGFDNNISPHILKHPANCSLMKHNYNMLKYSKCGLTLDELLYKIKLWDEKYGFA